MGQQVNPNYCVRQCYSGSCVVPLVQAQFVMGHIAKDFKNSVALKDYSSSKIELGIMIAVWEMPMVEPIYTKCPSADGLGLFNFDNTYVSGDFQAMVDEQKIK